MKYHLTELYNIDELQKLCESFTELTGAVTAILDLKGEVYVAAGWQPICTKFHRVNSQTKKCCTESDNVLSQNIAKGLKYNIYKCKNGLVDIAVPIIIEDKHVGNFFTGQFLLDEPDLTYFKAQAKTYGFNEQEYIKALKQVPIYTEEKAKKTALFLVEFAETIGKIGFKNLKSIENARQLEIEKKKAEDSEQYTNMLFQSSPIGLALAKLSGELVDVNTAYAKIIGYTIEETLKLSYWDITPKKYEQQEAEQLKSLNKKGAYGPYEKEYIHKSGKLIPVRLQGRIIEKQGEKYIWSSVENIADIKKAKTELSEKYMELTASEEELRATNEELLATTDALKESNIQLYESKIIAEESMSSIQAIIENTNSSIWAINTNYELIYINHVFANDFKTSFGINLSKGDNLLDSLPQPLQPMWKERYDRALCGEQFVFEDKVEVTSDVFIYIQVSMNPIIVNGNITGASFFGSNITPQKMHEQELNRAKEKAEEANRLKTEFINNMSHEIRTPMNGIIGFVEMLDNPNITEEKRTYFSRIIQNSSNQLLKIIDDILQISKLETRQVQICESEFCLNDLLMEQFSIFNLKSKVRNIPLYLKKELHDSQSFIITDKVKLNTILSNLLENALKFTNDGIIEFGYYLKDSNIIIFVKDTGVGISPEKHKIIFERFSQENKEVSLKHGGLGLGLSISKENAELLGGSITLESEKGKGTTFYVSIPHKPSQKNNCSDNNLNENVRLNGKEYTILIVEDEEVNYLYIETLFEQEFTGRYQLIHAKNGEDAVDICNQNPSISLILMDIKLPGMNGYEAVNKIRMKNPGVPIIAQTAYAAEQDEENALTHGCNAYISKPINKEKLFAFIHQFLKIERPYV